MSTAPTDAATTTPPEPDLTPEELLARAIALRPELIEHQADAEARAFYSEAMHQKFLDAGFYRTYVPRRYGGHEFDVRTMTRLQLETPAVLCLLELRHPTLLLLQDVTLTPILGRCQP